MAKLCIFKCFYLFIVLVINITTDLCHAKLKHSLAKHESYYIYNLTQEQICHPLGNEKTIKITRALIVEPSYIFKVDRSSGLKCKYIIKTSHHENLMVVIQNLSFRRNGSECLDYVRFKRKNHSEGKKYCGEFNYDKIRDEFIEYNINNGYGNFSFDGEVETTIFVSKQPLRSDDPPLNITLVYTPFKECFRSEGLNNYGQIYKRPTETSDYCLPEEYICDGIGNCLPGICQDEANCPEIIISNGIGTKVTITAVSTIVLCFVIFLMGLWICRRNHKLCWSPDCAGPPNPDDQRFTNANNRGSNNFTDQQSPSVPSAPMLQVAVLSSPADKDLPPSYDSLFPAEDVDTPPVHSNI
ncbi:uncharacterized protein LOC103578940 [Microplitis demolitor]|uniref:uncharacterized protein LOC103578940 n=1 Tax=Microplitis demolitor TaxID=69319 RepID=UPI0004CC93FD|nr:uncharacterized protein LOC103578940 [Microplitis demolitor]